MSKNILVNLRPFDYYFFGGEETFNSGAKGITNYHVRSNKLPQQTGMLGLLRHAFVDGGFPIGQSFKGADADFGAIKKISPLFLTDEEGNKWLPAPANINHKKAVLTPVIQPGQSFTLEKGWTDHVISLTGYEEKKGTSCCWINISNGNLLAEDDIFITKDHIGINKEKQLDINNDEGGFYKQEFMTLSKGFSFSCIVETNQDIDTKRLPRNLPFGGERRLFNLGYDENGESWESVKEKAIQKFAKYTDDLCCIILLSDSFVEDTKTLYQHIHWGIMDEQAFRNIITPATVTNFGSFTRKPEEIKNELYKSTQVKYMLKKGSFLFINKDKAGAVTKLLDNAVYQAAGFNHYLPFNH